MIGWGNGTSDASAPRSIEPSDIRWNTHRTIRTLFGYSLDEELYGEWLVWFYSMSQEQRVALRYENLDTINTEDFPPLPST